MEQVMTTTAQHGRKQGGSRKFERAEPMGSLSALSIDRESTALFLDFDGVLVDIAPRPDAVHLQPVVAATLNVAMEKLDGAVAIVTGRNVADVNRYLKSYSGIISGGHGAELLRGGKLLSPSMNQARRLEEMKESATEFAVFDPRVVLEDKTHGIVLHFRQNPEIEDKVRRFAGDLAAEFDEFEVQAAKMAFEIKPKGISKASAIARIMGLGSFAGRVPLYVGDDVTDETAFAYVNEQGGISVKVGDGPTAANYRASSPEEFRVWLKQQFK